MNEIAEQIDRLIETCDESDRQRFVKGVLLSLRGALAAGREKALFLHVCEFAEAELREIEALKAQAARETEWPEVIEG